MSEGKYMRHHLSMSIEGCLRHAGRKNLTGFMKHDDGRDATDAEIRRYLRECQLKGWTVVPCCKEAECPDFDHFGGGCPGHEISQEEYDRRGLHCGDCSLLEDEDISGSGWCAFHQEPRRCNAAACDTIIKKPNSK